MVNPTGPWANEEEDFHAFLRNGPQIVDASNTIFVVPTPTTESPAPESAISTAKTHSAVDLESASTELAIEDPKPRPLPRPYPPPLLFRQSSAVGKNRKTGLPRGSLMGHYYAW
ncbi:hypothetical protein ColKHC_07342 [Colletotrichum higginsianum]|nr:hypothetical protein ColKHC_07342 [Colletotrichum higginsianum]